MKNCPFCNMEAQRVVEKNTLFYAIRDKYPVTPLHTLLIPTRHVETYFDLDEKEVKAFDKMLKSQREEILSRDQEVSGFNVGHNAGKDAGQTVMHCHVHLIPRRHGDVEHPEGGVRGVIPKKQKYWPANSRPSQMV